MGPVFPGPRRSSPPRRRPRRPAGLALRLQPGTRVLMIVASRCYDRRGAGRPRWRGQVEAGDAGSPMDARTDEVRSGEQALAPTIVVTTRRDSSGSGTASPAAPAVEVVEGSGPHLSAQTQSLLRTR